MPVGDLPIQNSLSHQKDQLVKQLYRQKIKTPVKERFGINLPRSTREEMLLDKANGSNLWTEEIAKERTALTAKGVFKFHSPKTIMPKTFQ